MGKGNRQSQSLVLDGVIYYISMDFTRFWQYFAGILFVHQWYMISEKSTAPGCIPENFHPKKTKKATNDTKNKTHKALGDRDTESGFKDTESIPCSMSHFAKSG